MTSKTKALLDEVLRLPPSERAELVAEILASLEVEDSPTQLSCAWRAEVDRRVQRVLAGEATGAPWEEVRARIEARLGSQ